MTTSPTIKRIGQLVKTLRKQKGITGAELGHKVGLSQSKISKIETGHYTKLGQHEITKILNILDAPKTIRQQILAGIEKLDPATQPFYSNTRFYKLPYEYERRARHTKLFVLNSIPALLQTAEFRRAGLREYFGLSEEEISASIKVAFKRQDFLWDQRHKFHIIMHQAALYFMRGSKTIHIAQLDRIERMMGLPNLKIGIIPVEAGLPLAENGSFVLWDDVRLTKATASGDVYIDSAEEIELHAKIFGQLDRLAHYDDEARRLIRQAIDYFM